MIKLKYPLWIDFQKNRNIKFILSLPPLYILCSITIIMSMDYGSRPYPNRLQTFRKSAGLKQQHVATLLGLNNPTTLSEWENEKQMPKGTNQTTRNFICS